MFFPFDEKPARRPGQDQAAMEARYIHLGYVSEEVVLQIPGPHLLQLF